MKKSLYRLTAMLMLTACSKPHNSDDQNNRGTQEVPTATIQIGGDVPALRAPTPDIPELKPATTKTEQEINSETGFVFAGAAPDSIVGRGFTMATQNKMQSCLTGSIVLDDSMSSQSDHFEKITRKEDLKARLRFGALSDNYLMDRFLTNIDDESETTATYFFVSTAVLGTKHIDNIGFRVPTTDHQQFMGYCGDYYVSEVTLGGVFTAVIQLEFSQASDKSSFPLHLDLTQDIDESVLPKDMQKTASMKISIYQAGGTRANAPLLSEGNVLKCALDHFDACRNLLNDIQRYSSGEFQASVRDKPAVLNIAFNPYPLKN